MAIFKVICDDCGAEYEVGSRKKSKDGKFRCKSCKSRLYNQRHQDVIKKYNQSDAAKLKRREWRLKNYYGLSLEDYDRILEQQGGVCAICKTATESDNGQPLVVDHDHQTGKIRGLLCDKCNRAIGALKDDNVVLNNALLYLNKGQSWNEYFMSVAAIVSTRSKDPSTQVGAVIVKDKVIIATGYNGLPRQAEDTRVGTCSRDEKLQWTIHAEDNAIFNAARFGQSTLGTDIYVTPLYPCHKCTRGIIQAGIKRIFVQQTVPSERWARDFEISKQMCKETGTEIIYL